VNVEKPFTNHKFHVGLHVTFGLNDRRILIQYPSWSAKGFGEAFELLIVRWVKLLDSDIWLFCFDTLCQLACMIYVTNANAMINILSITASCSEYLLFVAHSSQESVTNAPKTSSRLE